MNFTALLPAILASVIPLLAWYAIIYRRNRKGMGKHFWMVFFLAGSGAFFFSFFQDLLPSRSIFSIGISLFFMSMAVEYFKNITVRIGGLHYIRSIDDAIDLSFAAALGFTGIENIIAFTEMFSGNNPTIAGDPIVMTKVFLIREFFVLPVHLFTSGLFGYFYGMALFSGKELREKNKKSIWFRMLSLFFFFLPSSRRFRAVKILQGTLISGLFYGIFFAFLQINPHVSTLFHALGMPILPVDESLVLLMSFVLFKVGTILFFTLLDKKRRWERQGLFVEQ